MNVEGKDGMGGTGDENTVAPGTGVEAAAPVSAVDGGMPTFWFGRYMLRPALPSDYDRAERWTAADPYHRNRTSPEFWFEQSGTVNSFILEDRQGPVFFFRIDGEADETACLHIQFPPDDEAMRLRVMEGMTKGFLWLEKQLGEFGYKRMYFHSANPPLIIFCGKRFGFEWDGKKLVKEIRKNGK